MMHSEKEISGPRIGHLELSGTENAFEVSIAELDQRDHQLGACVRPLIVKRRHDSKEGFRQYVG